MDYEDARRRGLRQTIELSSKQWDAKRRRLRQTIELGSIWIMRRQKGAAPDDRAHIYMVHGAPKRRLRQTIDLRYTSIMGRPKNCCAKRKGSNLYGLWDAKKAAAPDDRAQIWTMRRQKEGAAPVKKHKK